MLKSYLSEDVFRHAVILYLHNHSYAAIQSDDLWDSFNEVSNVDNSIQLSHIEMVPVRVT